jgi:AhpD family alkylhydroperoxidase
VEARMTNIAELVPDALRALQALGASAEQGGVPKETRILVEIRASQINGCGFCLDLGYQNAKRNGEADERLFSVAAWRHTPYFSDAERAALALTEAVTRLSDREDPVPDEVWNEAARYYDEQALASLIIDISLINVWNRFNVSTGQMACPVSLWA